MSDYLQNFLMFRWRTNSNIKLVLKLFVAKLMLANIGGDDFRPPLR
jgi:hypothetical protein